MALLGTALIPIMLVMGFAQIVLGFWGLDYLVGPVWGAVIGIPSLMLRFMLPFTVGTYFAVVAVLGMPWWVGILAAFPGIVFFIPGIVASVLELALNRR